MFTKPALLLRVEGAVALAVSILLYSESHRSWILFAVLFFSPDLFMLGHLVNTRIGAAIYNIVHTLFAPGILIVIAVFTSRQSFYRLPSSGRHILAWIECWDPGSNIRLASTILTFSMFSCIAAQPSRWKSHYIREEQESWKM